MTLFNGKCQNLHMSPTNFALTLTVSKIYKFKICDLKKVGRGHEMQFAQLHHSNENVKIYKCLPDIFRSALTVSDI